MKVNYKKTLNLPKTRFPMRGNLPVQEPQRIAEWESSKLYQKIIEQNGAKPRFILHDGPPYANGHIHSGTVLNKLLKDFVMKYRNMNGFQCEYRPGWDCHGLPIENNVEREEGKSKDEFTKADFREKCKAYAHRFVDIQRQEFKRLGVLADWDNPYLTLLHSYEATIAREFGKVVGAGALYKRKKPVYWCAHHVTALAEAEVEYKDLESPSIWVRFALNDDALAKFDGLGRDKPVSIVIWTTTPWTLPANLAITLHPELEYSAFDFGDEVMVVATEMVETFVKDCGLSQPVEVARVKGSQLDKTTARHPFIERDSLIINGEFVTTESGTGCVHTAPGHGVDDYEAGLKYGLDIYAPVDDRGRFTDEFPLHAGEFVFDTDPKIVAMLEEKGVLVHRKAYMHSYPICERCKNPIVFRATSQWFISMEKTGLRERALEIIPKVQWIPARGQQRIQSMVETRPDWCLSRQRIWGLPIVAFYCKDCEHPLVDQDVINHVADIFEKDGADVWYTRKASELLPEGTKCPKCSGTEFEQETDIVDVWFESGVSYAAVMENMYGEDTVVDLYLEGSDQHRGWFQSTLLESVLTRDRAPFLSVLTHGFVVDGEGKKISKTLGNFIPPEEIINEFGAEIYRLWVASENYQEDVRISDQVLKTLREAYMKIRNTLRYLLGTLEGFNPSSDRMEASDMVAMDRYILHQTAKFVERINESYETYKFHDIFHQLMQFVTVDLSAFYLDVIKDRLYVNPPFSKERRSARATLYEILSTLVRVLAPITSFTCEEVWQHMPHDSDDPESVFMATFPRFLTSKYGDVDLAEEFQRLLATREAVNKKLEEKRVDKVIGHSLDADVSLKVGEKYPASSALKAHADDLKEMLIVSQFHIEFVDGEDLDIEIKRATGTKCERCWHWSETTGNDEKYPGTCDRCSAILHKMKVEVEA